MTPLSQGISDQFVEESAAIVGFIVYAEVDVAHALVEFEKRLASALVGGDHDAFNAGMARKPVDLVGQHPFHSAAVVGRGYAVDYFHCLRGGSPLSRRSKSMFSPGLSIRNRANIMNWSVDTLNQIAKLTKSRNTNMRL